MGVGRQGASDFLSIEEVATRLNVSGETIRRWVREGRLQGTRVGRQWRIYPHDLERFLTRAGRPDASNASIWEPNNRSLVSDDQQQS